MKESRLSGQITVFLSLLLTIFISLVFSLFYSAVISGKRAMAENYIDLATDSMFAQYNRKLLEDYDLFYIDIKQIGADIGKTGLADKYAEILKDSMDYDNVPAGLLGYIDLLSLKQSTPEIFINKYSIASDNNGAVYRQQAINHMKSVFPDILNNTQGNNVEDESYGSEIDFENDYRKAVEALDNALETEPLDYVNGEDPPALVKPFDLNTDIVGYIDSLRAAGILEQVFMREVSKKSIDSYSLISKKESPNMGDGISTELGYNNALDDLLFNEYLLMHFGNAVNSKADRALDYEIEYILSGKESDRNNLEITAYKLLALREGANYLYLLSDETKVAEAESLGLALAILLLEPEVSDIMAQIILLAWAYGESLLDLRDLFDGYRVPIVKTAASFKLELINITDVFFQDYKRCEDPLALDYAAYLRILLSLNGKNKNVKRSMDMIEATLRADDEHRSFSMDSCVEFIDMSILLSIGRDVKYNKKFGYIQ